MLIVIEGIDGSGKSTILKSMQRLAPEINGITVRYLDKKQINCSIDEKTKETLYLLKKIIWTDDEFEKDPFGAMFWLKLISAWYSFLEPLSELELSSEIRVYDGWFYRNIVKTCLRKKINQKKVESFFEDVKQPDLTILIDIDPTIAWRRDPHKKLTEIGYWDGENGNPEIAYINYQTKVRKGLLNMAHRRGWIIITSKEENTPESLAYEIIDAITSSLFKL